ncbi:hypothetical protein ACSSS7_005045 [Eimeria intestinalis]
MVALGGAQGPRTAKGFAAAALKLVHRLFTTSCEDTRTLRPLSLEGLQGGWGPPRIRPLSEVSVHPGITALHYSISCLEGMKAFKAADGRLLLFRPLDHLMRFQRSAERLALPPPDPSVLLQLIRKFVRLEEDYVLGERACSLYLRPLLFSTYNFLPNVGSPCAHFADALSRLPAQVGGVEGFEAGGFEDDFGGLSRESRQAHRLGMPKWRILSRVRPVCPSMTRSSIMQQQQQHEEQQQQEQQQQQQQKKGFVVYVQLRGLRRVQGRSPCGNSKQPLKDCRMGFRILHLLWTLPENGDFLLTEAGAMSLFLLKETESGSLELLTPSLDRGLVLPGRDLLIPQ